MLTLETALPDLQRRLGEAAFDPAAPELARFWAVWQAWISEPVDGFDPAAGADQSGFEGSLDLALEDLVPGSGRPIPGFNLAFTRQFTHFEDDGELSYLEQLRADFSYPTGAHFQAIADANEDGFGSVDELWAPAGAAATPEWAATVEASESFRAAGPHAPAEFAIDQAPV